jgi:hypothetical protein
MMVANRRLKAASLFNYGTFLFDRRVLPEFIQGRLRFWASMAPAEVAFLRYIKANRSVRLQELNLDPRQTRMVVERLYHDVQPQNRYYLYHHYYDNCSTRLRDIINEAVEGQLEKACSRPGRLDLRHHTRRHAQVDPVAVLVMDLLLNDQVDRPPTQCNEAFLPAELARQVGALTYRNSQGQRVPLVSRSTTVFEAVGREPVPDRPQAAWPLTLVIGLLIGSGAIVLGGLVRAGRRAPARIGFGLLHMVVGLVPGLMGTLLFFMANFTDHQITQRNENLFLANPLTLLALPLGFFIALGRVWAFRWMRYAFLLLAASSGVLPLLKTFIHFDQNTALPVSLLVPVNTGLAFAHWISNGKRKNRRRSPLADLAAAQQGLCLVENRGLAGGPGELRLIEDESVLPIPSYIDSRSTTNSNNSVTFLDADPALFRPASDTHLQC